MPSKEELQHIPVRLARKASIFVVETPRKAKEGIVVYALLPQIDKLVDATEIDFPKEAATAYQQYIKEGATPFISCSHDSHAGVFYAVKVMQQARALANAVLPTDRQITSFVMPVAVSLESGDQGGFLRKVFRIIKKPLADKGLQLEGTLTKNDRTKRNLKSTDVQTANIARLLLGAQRHGQGIILFPEGRVQGGRRREGATSKDDVYGLQTPVEGLSKLMRKMSEGEKNIVILPVGIYGANRLFDPTDATFPKEAWNALLFGWKKDFVKIHVGMPFTGKQMLQAIEHVPWEYQDEAMNNYLMYRIAELLPENARGQYPRIRTEPR